MFEERFHEAVNLLEWQLIILANATAGISLIAAAGPYRLNLTSVEYSPKAQSMLPMSMTG